MIIHGKDELIKKLLSNWEKANLSRWKGQQMELFRKKNKELDDYLNNTANNAANNYKDAAQRDFKQFVELFEKMKASNTLTEKQIRYYEGMQLKYEQELRGFHH